MTCIIFTTTTGCEFLTPFYPQHFLALASIASVGKAIALAAYIAIQPTFQKSLCTGMNLSGVVAVNQAQVRANERNKTCPTNMGSLLTHILCLAPFCTLLLPLPLTSSSKTLSIWSPSAFPSA